MHHSKAHHSNQSLPLMRKTFIEAQRLHLMRFLGTVSSAYAEDFH